MILCCSATKILPKRSTEPGGTSFKTSCQKAADLLSLTIDGKQKEFEASVTYANVKSILKNIQKSAFFEKLNQPQQPSESCELNENASDETGDEKANEETNAAAASQEDVQSATSSVVEAGNVNDSGESGTVEYQEAPSASAVPVPIFTPQQPHVLSTPNIGGHPAPQNLNTLPPGKHSVAI